MLNKLINKKNKNSESGFTIIEVLIVLAIAGLILVVVLIAIPQLQRNQRNTSRQSDAARVGTSVSNIMANNNGRIMQASDLPNLRADIGDLSQYDIATQPTLQNFSSDTAESDVDTMIIVTGAQCGDVSGIDHDSDPNTDPLTGRGAVDGTSRQVAIIYGIEAGGGGQTPACVDI